MTVDREELLELLNAALRLGDPIIPFVGTLIEIADRDRDPSVLRVFKLGGDAADGLRAPLRKVSIGVHVERGGGVRPGLERWYHFPLPFTILELPPNPPPFDDWLRFAVVASSDDPLLYSTPTREAPDAYDADDVLEAAERFLLAFGPGKG